MEWERESWDFEWECESWDLECEFDSDLCDSECEWESCDLLCDLCDFECECDPCDTECDCDRCDFDSERCDLESECDALLLCGSVEQHVPEKTMLAIVELVSEQLLRGPAIPDMVPGHGMEQACCPMHAVALAVRFQ